MPPYILERLREEIRKAIDEEMEKYQEAEKKKEGVIVRPGDVVLHRDDIHIVLNKKCYPDCPSSRIPTRWIYNGTDREYFDLDIDPKIVTTLDGRPVIGFRDNDE